MTTKLDEKQYELVNQYVGMLDTIEEALKYVEASFTDLSKTEGDRVLSDVFMAISQISESNGLLKGIFDGREGIQQALTQFDTVADQAWKLDGQLDNNTVKQSILQEKLSPAFSKWKAFIDNELNPYLTH
ncbi:hypothetical protein [Rossellomorea aquimaris]|uniref:DUF8042 domain-containing protein n=1 Tax=Rossellomorea aquimaris TaxID=189382 RepID=A0A5D4TM47_9BACI|nr:hypothetical protein [Rossellomorea aquimaris]TYS76850.1 hypothetical protein FZD05_16735 [Rossellomorea aquimaris]TYS83755.1 hypothetical protein FZC85_17340 [Rossellomorea aquimaris]